MNEMARGRLLDALGACEVIAGFVQGRTFEEYERSSLLRSAVERQFEIVGEVLRRAKLADTSTGATVSNLRRIVHGYDVVLHFPARRHEVRKGAIQELLDRITIDPAICHGKPTVRGLRYPVEALLDLLSAGMTVDEILADYPDLERDDILAALAYAARVVRLKRIEITTG